MKKIVFFFLIIASSFSLFAQTNKGEKEKIITTRILFLFDGSQSMFGRWQSDMKINIARKIMSNLLDSLKSVPNLELALRCYGHTKNYPPQDCDDTKLEVPFGPNNHETIKYKLKTINPRGTTPIAYSLEKCATDFPQCSDCRNIIILITDGLEECNGDPCAVSLALQKKGIILKPFIIGIGKSFREQFECVGTYFDATTEKQFTTALNIVISQALNSTTCQINLLDNAGNPTETNVNITFYDKLSQLPKYNFIHSLNNKGFPDTLVIDPLLNYRVQVHTIPPVFIDSLKLTPGKHTTAGVLAAQGYLEIKTSNKNIGNPILCIVRENNKPKTLNTQFISTREKYLCGLYDLEIMTLPRTYIENVKIEQNTTTTVEIPSAGTAIFQFPSAGYGSVYLKKENSLEWIYNFAGNGGQEILLLQPGEYVAVFRSKSQSKSMLSAEKSFSVKSASIVKINMTLF